MFGWLFKQNKGVEKIEEETKRGFESVKKDIRGISGWIKHLDSEKNMQKREIEIVKETLSTINDEIENIKNMVAMLGNLRSSGEFKIPGGLSNKQTGVELVQTAVQTAVQTPKLEQFSMTEKALLWILLNTDMKLSYEDLAAMMGKEKSTIRSQINGIKQKSDGLILEKIEKNGKKRVYVPEEIKEIMLKKSKVRVKNKGKKIE